MQPTEIASGMTFYRAPDGRIVFRPWGARGACYLLTEQQRLAYSRYVAVAYAAMLLGIWLATLRFGWRGAFAAAFGGLVLIYFMYWIFSRGLPVTEPPPPPARGEVQRAMTVQAGAYGRPVVVLLLVGASAMSLLSLWLVAITSQFSLLLGFAFFGACAGVFGWQLRLLSRK